MRRQRKPGEPYVQVMHVVIKEEIERYYEEKLKQTQGRQDVFDRIGAKGFRSGILRKMAENN